MRRSEATGAGLVVLGVTFRPTPAKTAGRAPSATARLARVLGSERKGERVGRLGRESRSAVAWALRSGKGMVLDPGRPDYSQRRIVIHETRFLDRRTVRRG